jgi:type II secretory pathway pseudopilin PulG
MKRPVQLKNRCQGFTMTKITMVLTIVTVLIVGLFLVQGFIERSRITQAIENLNLTTAAVFAYQDRYGRIPGDDGPAATLAARGTGWSGVTAGNVNGRLDVGVNQVFIGSGESGPFWQQLKAARFVSGEASDSGQQALLDNPWGGLVSVLGNNMGGDLEGNKVCLSQVPGAAALIIDTELDDADGASGRLRATLGSQGANTNPSNAILSALYSEDDFYTICYRL